MSSWLYSFCVWAEGRCSSLNRMACLGRRFHFSSILQFLLWLNRQQSKTLPSVCMDWFVLKTEHGLNQSCVWRPCCVQLDNIASVQNGVCFIPWFRSHGGGIHTIMTSFVSCCCKDYHKGPMRCLEEQCADSLPQYTDYYWNILSQIDNNSTPWGYKQTLFCTKNHDQVSPAGSEGSI